MSTDSKDLISLVEKLRQEQEFVSFYKRHIQLSVQELNGCCDTVFYSLWLSHTLSYGLHRVLAHHLHTVEWSFAFSRASFVNFVNASQAIQSSFLVEQYSSFLGKLLGEPKLLAEVLRWAETEGLDCNWFINDLMSVVYGHCMFQRDHMLFLLLLKELLRHLVKGCDSPKDLLSGVEPVFNRALSEYCSQLVELRTFLTEALQEPLMHVLMCEDYLEYDVNKAGSRFQAHSEGQSGPLLDSSAFLFSEDLESSCEQLAILSTLFLENLNKMLGQFPLSLRWLLGNLKSLMHQKWSGISQVELRRPISDILFGSILSLAIVNPESYGIIDPSMVIGPVVRYNLSQIMAVLQGCVWILDKPSSSKFPIHKVIKRINVKLLSSLLDSVDKGYQEEVPDLLSSLPGLKRSAYLASQAQLDNLVGVVYAMATSLSDKEDSGPSYPTSSTLLSHIPPAIRELASSSPYSLQTKPLSLPPSSSQDLADTKTTPKKKLLDGSKTTSRPTFHKRRSNSTSHHLSLDVKTPSTTLPRSNTLSHSSTLDLKSKQTYEKQFSHSVSPSNSFMGTLNFQLPPEVLVIPFLDQVDVGRGADQLNTARWDFDLLSEEEYMGHQSPTPTYQRVDTAAPDEPTLSPLLTPDNSLASPPSPKCLNPSSSLDRSPASQLEEPPSPRPTLNSVPPLPVHGSPVIDKPVLKVQTPVSSPKKKERKSSTPSTFDVSHRDTLKPVTSPVTAVGEISGGDHSKQTSSQMEFLFPETPSPEGVSTGSSMENLLDTEGAEMEKEIGGSPAQSKKFKRLRKFRDRLRRKKGVEMRERKPRSKSMTKEKSAEDVEATMDLQKRRSRSEVPLSPREEEEDESPRAIHRNRRSYTMLTGHITAKYAAKKKAESVRNANRKSSTETPKKDAVDPKVDQQYESVAEVTAMSPAKFKRTFYNSQLKYKLRVALQGVHAPLSNNPVYLQQCADKDCSYQLTLLLQTALRHSRWQHSEMETALLTELLKMVDPMPQDLVKAAVEGVYDDYTKRSEYTSYLVKSQQKFQDARLQVGAVQTAVNRMQQVQQELFVNFAVQLFLEGQEMELGRTTQQLGALYLADEKCSLMEECLRTFTDAIQEEPTWSSWTDMEQVVNCLEDHLFAHVYDHVFHPNGDSDMMRDQIFSQHLSRLSETTSPTHKSLQIPSVYHSGCPWMSAQKHLKAMAVYKSPRGKLHCVVQSCKILISLLQYAKCGDPPGADDLFPVLVYTLIKANPPSLLSTIQYVRNFAEARLVGEDAYWWAQFSTAVEFTKTLE